MRDTWIVDGRVLGLTSARWYQGSILAGVVSIPLNVASIFDVVSMVPGQALLLACWAAYFAGRLAGRRDHYVPRRGRWY